MQETSEAIRTDYEWAKFHARLQTKALDWERHNDDSQLLRGKQLRDAEKQLAIVGKGKDPQPTELQRHYISNSQEAENRQCRRATIVSSVIAILLLAVGIAGIILLDRTPAKVNTAGQVFEIRNRIGYRFLRQDVGSTISAYAEPQTFTPDGEYRFIVGTDTDGERPGTVLTYDIVLPLKIYHNREDSVARHLCRL